MQTNVENLGALERRLNVSVPQEKIETEVESRLKRLARTAKFHGFRPGKVPLKIVAQQYGPQVRQEVMEDVLKKNFSEAVRENNLRVAGYPRFESRPFFLRPPFHDSLMERQLQMFCSDRGSCRAEALQSP